MILDLCNLEVSASTKMIQRVAAVFSSNIMQEMSLKNLAERTCQCHGLSLFYFSHSVYLILFFLA